MEPIPDPRLPGQQPQYSRDNIAAALASFYRSLPHVDPSLVHLPPPEGWSEINSESLVAAGMRRPCDRVVDLIRHLPYIDGNPLWITPETFPVNYRTAVPLAAAVGVYKPKWVHALSADLRSSEDFPPWVFALTMSVNRDGDIWLLDTMDGTVTKYVITGAVYPEPVGRYEEGDPRMWREKLGDDVTLPLGKWLEGILEKYTTFSYFGIPRHKDPGVLWCDQDWSKETTVSCATQLVQNFTDDYLMKELKEILSQHGWPENYSGKECRQKLADWMAQADI